MLKVLTIAGSDPSGGAGIQADLKTFAAHRVYGASVITALTAQNTQGVQQAIGLEPAFVAAQLESVFSDIEFDAIKIGMLYSQPIMEVVLAALRKYARCPIALDPVMVATSGDLLLQPEAISYLKEYMLPVATLCTPNLHEARVLTGKPLSTQEEALAEIKTLAKTYHTSILLKGGHPINPNSEMATDTLVFADGENHAFSLPRLNTPNTHGTGCTLSSALACRLAEGLSPVQAVPFAKDYLHRALLAGTYLHIGQGRGPVWHAV